MGHLPRPFSRKGPRAPCGLFLGSRFRRSERPDLLGWTFGFQGYRTTHLILIWCDRRIGGRPDILGLILLHERHGRSCRGDELWDLCERVGKVRLTNRLSKRSKWKGFGTHLVGCLVYGNPTIYLH